MFEALRSLKDGRCYFISFAWSFRDLSLVNTHAKVELDVNETKRIANATTDTRRTVSHRWWLDRVLSLSLSFRFVSRFARLVDGHSRASSSRKRHVRVLRYMHTYLGEQSSLDERGEKGGTDRTRYTSRKNGGGIESRRDRVQGAKSARNTGHDVPTSSIRCNRSTDEKRAKHIRVSPFRSSVALRCYD